MIFSKTDERCIKCQHFNDCDNKRLVACAIMPAIEPIMQPLIREKVDIHLSSDMVVSVYRDEIQKQLTKKLYKQLQCPFNYGA